jgi:hypothetical protein
MAGCRLRRKRASDWTGVIGRKEDERKIVNENSDRTHGAAKPATMGCRYQRGARSKNFKAKRKRFLTGWQDRSCGRKADVKGGDLVNVAVDFLGSQRRCRPDWQAKDVRAGRIDLPGNAGREKMRSGDEGLKGTLVLLRGGCLCQLLRVFGDRVTLPRGIGINR